MVRGTLHSLRGSDPGAWGSEWPGACPHVRGDVHLVLGAWGRPWARHAPRRQKTGDLSSDGHPVANSGVSHTEAHTTSVHPDSESPLRQHNGPRLGASRENQTSSRLPGFGTSPTLIT